MYEKNMDNYEKLFNGVFLFIYNDLYIIGLCIPVFDILKVWFIFYNF